MLFLIILAEDTIWINNYILFWISAFMPLFLCNHASGWNTKADQIRYHVMVEIETLHGKNPTALLYALREVCKSDTLNLNIVSRYTLRCRDGATIALELNSARARVGYQIIQNSPNSTMSWNKSRNKSAEAIDTVAREYPSFIIFGARFAPWREICAWRWVF